MHCPVISFFHFYLQHTLFMQHLNSVLESHPSTLSRWEMDNIQNAIKMFKQGQTLSLLSGFFLIPYISQFTTNCKFKGQLS